MAHVAADDFVFEDVWKLFEDVKDLWSQYRFGFVYNFYTLGIQSPCERMIGV